MNWRAAGCLASGIGVFLAVGLLGLWLAMSTPTGCSPTLQWVERLYRPIGTPAPQPAFEHAGTPVELGSTFIGLSTRAVYGPPGSSSAPSAADRPAEIALDCGDGTYQTYRHSGDLPAETP